MKKISVIVMSTLLAASAWALTKTGMPALDELRDDVEKNGALSRKLGFTEEQRKEIKEYIDEESEDLVEKRDEMVKAEKKVERKEDKKVDKKGEAMTEAKETRKEATDELAAAREEIFSGLKDLMKEDQYEALKKWRAEGKAGKR